MTIIKCTWCNSGINEIDTSRHQKYRYKKTGRIYCSIECGKKYNASTSSITMAKTNKIYASERMKKNNPMKNIESREKMKATLKSMNHKPAIQGGNGKGPTVPQKLLAYAIGWDMEIIVKTKQKRNSGYPYHYKIDIGNEKLKIGIEVDGNSHGLIERQKQDIKKTKLLNSLGWKIIRFKNDEVIKNLGNCIEIVLGEINNG